MATITIRGHFDGEQIRLDEPVELAPNTKLLITVLPEASADEDDEAWYRLAQQNLARAYGEDEPDYSTVNIKDAPCRGAS